MPPASLQLNCDLAEGADVEAAVMPFIDQANIACGAHAGSPQLMRESLRRAREHGVQAGAHPGYPDREHFGRHSLECAPEDIARFVCDQLEVLQAIAAEEGVRLTHIKPHGALYHDSLHKVDVREAVLRAVGRWQLPLMMAATPDFEKLQHEARAHGVVLMPEAFADRRYADDGCLLPRDQPGAILDTQAALAQAGHLKANGTVFTAGGQALAVRAETLCLHGDSPAVVEMARGIREILDA